MDEQDWYEKDLSDFDDPHLSDEEREGLSLKKYFPEGDFILFFIQLNPESNNLNNNNDVQNKSHVLLMMMIPTDENIL